MPAFQLTWLYIRIHLDDIASWDDFLGFCVLPWHVLMAWEALALGILRMNCRCPLCWWLHLWEWCGHCCTPLWIHILRVDWSSRCWRVAHTKLTWPVQLHRSRSVSSSSHTRVSDHLRIRIGALQFHTMRRTMPCRHPS